MTDFDYNELFHGKEIAEKEKLFKIELEAINEKHKDFFKERPSRFESQEHDNLYMHYMIRTANGQVTFAFTDNELPEHIKNDCIEAFNKVYPGAEKK